MYKNSNQNLVEGNYEFYTYNTTGNWITGKIYYNKITQKYLYPSIVGRDYLYFIASTINNGQITSYYGLIGIHLGRNYNTMFQIIIGY